MTLAYTISITPEDLNKVEDTTLPFEAIDSSVDLEPLIERLHFIVENKLSPREREIIKYLYGFGDIEPMKVTDIAHLLGLSRGTVTYYIKRAFNKFNKEFTKFTTYYEASI